MKKLEILKEDDHIIAVNKPAGVLSIPDRFNKDIYNLYHHLQQYHPAIYTVHRLDKWTSGVIVFAKSEESHKALSMAFMNRETEKYYTAIAEGCPTDGLMIDRPIIESKTQRGKYIVSNKGKDSQSEIHVVSCWDHFSLLEVRIYTGRTHQIRVHLSAIGHPLMVDNLYGKREQFFLSEIKRKKYRKHADEVERPLLSRQPLHARRLVITDASTGMTYDIEAPLHKDMKATINQLNKIYGA